MKGKLVKYKKGWMVTYPINSVLLHPDDVIDVEQHIEATRITHGVEPNLEVEFDIVEVFNKNEQIGYKYIKYAKLVDKLGNEDVPKLGYCDNMFNLPTAKEFYQNYIEENNYDSNIDIEEMMLEFAKLHVEDALRRAKENSYTEEQVNEKINLAIQEFERLKSKAQSLKDVMYLDGVLAVLDSIKNQSLKQPKQ
jgi:hypothetical protein